MRAVVDLDVLISAALSDDDYLLALAISRRAFLVTGDHHLRGLRGDLPILAPAEFVTKLREHG